MKLTIERAALLKALAHVQSVVERRNTIPILANVLVTAQKSRLSLAATDMDLSITESVEASVAKPGSTTAPAHTLYEIVRKLPDGAQVELETSSDDSTLVIRAGRASPCSACRRPISRRSPKAISRTASRFRRPISRASSIAPGSRSPTRRRATT
jgi:DNA polymerase-3 subunit beta